MSRLTSLGLIASMCLCLLAPMTPVALAARDGNPSQCPLPIPTGERLDWEMEHHAWEAAKRLSGAPAEWKKPGATVRYGTYFVNQEEIYGGFYYDPTLFLAKDGRIYSCEYIEIWIPSEDEAFVEHVLTHEYLHAIFVRFVHADQVFALNHRDEFDDGGEAWVQELLPHPDGWGE